MLFCNLIFFASFFKVFACFNVCHVCFISDTKVIYLFNIRVVFSLKVLFLFRIVYTLRFKLFLGITKLCSLQSLGKGIQVAFMEGSRLNPRGGKSEIVKKNTHSELNFRSRASRDKENSCFFKRRIISVFKGEKW